MPQSWLEFKDLMAKKADEPDFWKKTTTKTAVSNCRAWLRPFPLLGQGLNSAGCCSRTARLCLTRSTVDEKLEKKGDIIHQYGAGCFRKQEPKTSQQAPTISRRQQEIKKGQLKKLWQRADQEVNGTLQADNEIGLVSLCRADSLT